ncbi:basic proline-rich protein-like [Portunus trituberculatus]|uniref:basic proline-rich protein-like n=1 Tax=Portunus trituberculatus TaxID=210409 RepID=UPI001E1CCFDB|nr:basic proline-rich protein-like [Portunus trituberculatus]
MWGGLPRSVREVLLQGGVRQGDQGQGVPNGEQAVQQIKGQPASPDPPLASPPDLQGSRCGGGEGLVSPFPTVRWTSPAPSSTAGLLALLSSFPSCPSPGLGTETHRPRPSGSGLAPPGQPQRSRPPARLAPPGQPQRGRPPVPGWPPPGQPRRGRPPAQAGPASAGHLLSQAGPPASAGQASCPGLAPTRPASVEQASCPGLAPPGQPRRGRHPAPPWGQGGLGLYGGVWSAAHSFAIAKEYWAALPPANTLPPGQAEEQDGVLPRRRAPHACQEVSQGHLLAEDYPVSCQALDPDGCFRVFGGQSAHLQTGRLLRREGLCPPLGPLREGEGGDGAPPLAAAAR